MFTVWTPDGVRTLPMDDVQDVYFDVGERRDDVPWREAVTAPAAPQEPQLEPPHVSARAAPALPGPLGEPSASLTLDELATQGGSYSGKVVKLEFHVRGEMRKGVDGNWWVTVTSVPRWSSVALVVPEAAMPWIRSLPENPEAKPKPYYLYGVVVPGEEQWHQGRQVESWTVKPVGRRTKRGLRNSYEYYW